MLITQDKRSFFLEIGFFLLLLSLFTLIPLSQVLMQGSLFGVFLLTIVMTKKNNYSLEMLGLTFPAKPTIFSWIFCTLGMSLVVILLKIIYPGGIFNGVLKDRSAFLYIIPFYVLVGTFMQEFVFRGYFFARTRNLFSIEDSILLNILTFSAFHLPYLIQIQSNLMYLSITAGVCWSIMYSKYPNLYLAWLSHAIVGGLTLVLLQSF